jgi:serine/threonine-protein kinase
MVWWKKTGLILLGILLVIILLNSIIMPWYVRHDTLVQVPSVVGLNYDEAVKILDDAGLEGVQGDIRYDATKPIGTVIDQNPPAERTVKDGRRIYLIVSGGEQLYDVPNLVGRTLREGKFTLAQRNLELLEVETKPSAQYPAGIIVSQIESPGSKVKKGTKIGVVVSTGMEAGDLKIPDLIGKNLEEAKKILIANKFAIGKINYQPTTTVPLNAVVDQYPKANTLAKENQKIDLFVNREIKKTVKPADEEMNVLEKEEKDIEKKKDTEIEKQKDTEKKTEPRKGDKNQPEKKDDKKKTEPITPKDKKENDKKDDEGTKF